MWLILSHSRITGDGSKELPRAANNRWVNFEVVRASNDWKPNGMIFMSFGMKDGWKKPSKPNCAGAEEEDFSRTAIAAIIQESIGREKWQGNGKQGKGSAARACAAFTPDLHCKARKATGGGGVWRA